MHLYISDTVVSYVMSLVVMWMMLVVVVKFGGHHVYSAADKSSAGL